ncbi:hypothetical protein CRUP_019938 [Coryphaenoides rupestris]|nr:hypothetical protein CRUP_019938 [Coryphaenoides rupestris]
MEFQEARSRLRIANSIIMCTTFLRAAKRQHHRCRSAGSSPPRWRRAAEEGVYDVPPPQSDLRNHQGIYDVPPSAQALWQAWSSRCMQSGVGGARGGGVDFWALVRVRLPPNSELPGLHRRQQNHHHPRYPPANDNEGIYDVPPAKHHSNAAAGCQGGDLYDIPRGMQQQPAAAPDAPRRGRGPTTGQGRVRHPRRAAGLAARRVDVTDGVNRLSFSSTGSTRSSMSTSSSSTGSGTAAEGRLALDLDAAVQRLFRLQQALEASVGAVQSLASSPHWRTPAFAERHGDEVRAALDRVRAVLGDLLAFGRGAAANATALSDPGLHAKLRRQLGRLEDSQQILLQTFQTLETCGWTVAALAASPAPSSSARQQQQQQHARSDELDRFVMVSRTLPDDAKQLASTIQGSAELLFSRRGVGESLSHPLGYYPSPDNDNNYSCPVKAFPPVPSGQEKDNMNMNSEKCVKSWMEDYDYVHLQILTDSAVCSQGKEDFERQQKELLDKENIIKQNRLLLGPEQINQFKKLEQEVAKPVENDITQWMSQSHQHSSPSDSPSSSSSSSLPTAGVAVAVAVGVASRVSAHDRQLLVFYAQQCEQHFVTLLNAVDAFFACVGAGQPPRIFVAHGKFVILSAHKLVFIGDTLSRQAGAPEVANCVMNASNVLCDLLKTVVGATKAAALSYPSTGAVQEMVDRVTELSHRARQFKEQLLHMAAL